MLLRVRNEMKMTTAAYETLYQTAVNFSMRKQLKAEEGKAEMESSIETMTERKRDLDN